MDPALRLTLRQGTVYYMQHRGLSSPEPHYLLVLNHDPLAGHVLLLSCVTSKVDALVRRRAAEPGTVVHVTPAEYPELSVDSAIDCNVVFALETAELSAKLRAGTASSCHDLPAAVLDRILAAIAASRIVSREHKRLIAGHAGPPHPDRTR